MPYPCYWLEKAEPSRMDTVVATDPNSLPAAAGVAAEALQPQPPGPRHTLPRTTPARPGITHITVKGARQHNLRNVDVSIPRNTLTVVTGLSGSGKSSLAFDTIYAEGQRRYVETLSAYARQFLDQMERPDVDAIDGLSPAISIEQKTTSRSPRSTVGTITEIYDYLRLLYASVGQPHCPNCDRPISRQSAEQIVRARRRPRSRRAHHRLRADRPRPQGRVPRRARSARPAGLPRAHRRRDDRAHRGHAARRSARTTPSKPSSTASCSSRCLSDPGADVNASLARRFRRQVRHRAGSKPASRKASAMANGLVMIGLQQGPGREMEETLFSSSMACPDCGINVPQASSPRSFSFNSNYGACPECHGLGSIYDFDPGKTITDWSKPLLDGAMGPGSALLTCCDSSSWRQISTRSTSSSPLQTCPKSNSHLLLYGPPAGEAGRTGFHGIFAYLRSNLEETKSDGYREYMMQYMSATLVPQMQRPPAPPRVTRRHQSRCPTPRPSSGTKWLRSRV